MRIIAIISFLLLAKFAMPNQLIDSLERELVLKRTPLEKANVLNSIATEYERGYKYDKSVSFLLQGILLLEEEDQVNLERVSELKINIGNIYAYMFEYEVSTRYYLEAINCYDDKSGATIKAGAFGNIALNYVETGDTKRAKAYFYKSKNLIESNGPLMNLRDSTFLSFDYAHLALIYAADKELDSTNKYMNKAGELVDTSIVLQKTMFLMSHIEVLTLLDRLEDAEMLLGIFKKKYGFVGLADELWFHISAAKVKLRNSSYENALVDLHVADSIAEIIKSKLDQIKILKLKEECLIGLGKYALAYRIREKHDKLSDSLINPQVLHKMFDVLTEQEVDYYEEKRKVEELTLAKDSQIQQYSWYIGLSATGFITFLSGLVLYRNGRKKKISDAKLYAAELEEKRLHLKDQD